jgi:hypothetical protein
MRSLVGKHKLFLTAPPPRQGSINLAPQSFALGLRDEASSHSYRRGGRGAAVPEVGNQPIDPLEVGTNRRNLVCPRISNATNCKSR